MKTLIIAACSIFAAVFVMAAQPHNIGSVKAQKIVLAQYTLAQINSLTPDATGQLVLCSNCTRSTVCVSSGSVNPGSWVIAVATGTFGGTTFSGLQHCQ